MTDIKPVLPVNVSGDPLPQRIVIFGQSCSGKTTFARSLPVHEHVEFDRYFPWHVYEAFGGDHRRLLAEVLTHCPPAPHALDGWHLSDAGGECLPSGHSVVCVYCDYERLVSQYRIPVSDPEEFRRMHTRWYREVDYAALPGVRFFRNGGSSFDEMSPAEFFEVASAL